MIVESWLVPGGTRFRRHEHDTSHLVAVVAGGFVEMEYDVRDGLLYVAYRAVQNQPHGESNAAFWNRVFAFADANPVAQFVLDIRENSGGEGNLNLRVVRDVMARPALAQRLYVVIGPRTFSAAMNLATELERYAQPTFVGEPAGTSPHFYGNHRPLVLPNNGIPVNVSSIWWQTQNPRDRRAFLPPALFTPRTAADYRSHRVDAAILVFAINVRAYPGSPNVHDSLGEAYETAGRRELAIASYRRALALDPDYPPSLVGLERLGAR